MYSWKELKMTTHNCTPNQWQIIGSCLILATTATQANSTPPPFQANIGACFYERTQKLNENTLPHSTQTADDYITRTRQNPRRKEAMDKAAQKIAMQLSEQGETIVSLRLAKGFTQSELAHAAGLQQSYLSRIENQACTISDNNINKIATALNCTPEMVRTAFQRHWQQMDTSL